MRSVTDIDLDDRKGSATSADERNSSDDDEESLSRQGSVLTQKGEETDLENNQVMFEGSLLASSLPLLAASLKPQNEEDEGDSRHR